MVEWHHRLNGREFEQTLRDGEGQGSLACCSPWWSQRVGPELATEQHVFYKPYDFRFLSFLLLAILPIASSCCTEVSHHISRRLLERVTTCRIQRADGDCDLAAVILHVKRRRVCVSPHNHVIKQWMNEQAAKKEAKGNICHKKRHHGRRNSKGAHRERQETHGHKTPY
uniref:C-C motif chemokine n=1 Tax=Bos indicus x Bos taurus TaxID=30522 RepID=A0A4W2FGE8_BOBOX